MAPESSDTFAFYAKDWWLPGKCPYIKEHERNGRILSNNFIRSSRSALLRYILPAFKAKHLCDITTHDIDEWKYALVEKKGLSNKSANCYLSIVKTMFDYWWCHGFIKEDPAKKVKQMYARCRERGEVYYDFDYTKTKKEILQNLSVSTNLVGRPQAESLSTIKDRRLLQLLQGDFSKVLDENGEPLVLCHGIGEEFKKQEGKTLVRQVDEYFKQN
jgi:site-specific recombinase XerD